jgi:hypothetical protein
MLSLELHSEIENELARAEQARKDGLEGRARVCARRAAGIVLRAYFQSHQVPKTHFTVYDLLQRLRDEPRTAPELRRIAILLLTRVNEDFQLPVEGDLIAETRQLVLILEKDII